MSSLDVLALGIVALSESLAVLCAIRLWRRAEDPKCQRVFWTGVLCLPVVGPLFFGALHGRAASKRDVPANPSFDLSRFDPADSHPPAER